MSDLHVLTDAEAEGYIAAGTTARDLVRLRWPDMTAEEADWVLWERTPFPLARGVHDIADAVAAIDETTCGDMTLAGFCRRKVRRFGEACWQHRPPLTVRRAPAALAAQPTTTEPS